MERGFLAKDHLEALELRFVFDRILVHSPYGKEVKAQMKPYLKADIALLTHRHHLIEQTLFRLEEKRYEIQEIQTHLKALKQLKTTFERLKNGETLTITELFEIKSLAFSMKRILECQKEIHWEQTIGDFELKSILPVIELLDPDGNFVNNFHIYSSYSQALYDVRLKLALLEQEIKKSLVQKVESLKANGLKVTASGEVRINKSDEAQLEMASSYEFLAYQMDMAMYSLYKILPDPALEEELSVLRVQEEEEEEAVRAYLSKALMGQLQLILYNVECLGELDFLIAIAQFCKGFKLVKPTLSDTNVLTLKGARHLKVEAGLVKENKAFVPIDVDIHKSVTMITGANMGGKTISLKTIGQVIAMAQYGFFVPCEKAEMPLYDFLFVSIGDAQNIDMGLSTFGAEIINISRILEREQDNGVILIDELARGTNPREGYAISKALIEYLKETSLKAVITTHYDGLTSDEDIAHYQVNGLKDVSFDSIQSIIQEKGIQILHELMDYRLTKVTHHMEIPKEAIRIADIMGLNQSIVIKAKEILGGAQNE